MRSITAPTGAALLFALVLGACSSSGSTRSSSSSTSTTRPPGGGSSTVSPRGCGSTTTSPGSPTREVNPPGDIPDDQAFVTFRSTAGAYHLDVPEGWSQSESGSTVDFTDKLNTIRVEVVPA